MTANGQFQYLADTLLLEKILMIEEGLTKKAGLVDMFRGIASTIQEQVSERVKQEGILGTLATYLVPTMLGRIWPPLGIIAGLASLWGFSIGNLMNKIVDTLKPKIESGQQITLNEINEVGKSAAQSEIGESLSVEAGNDLFFHLRKIEASGQLTRLVRTAQYYGSSPLSRSYKASPWLQGSGDVLGRIFGSVGKLRGKWLIAGIIIWFIKTVLIGAGLIEGTKYISDSIGLNKEKNNKSESGTEEKTLKTELEEAEFRPISINIPLAKSHNLKSSGDGTQYHPNDESSVWIVPLFSNSVQKTLVAWSTSIYPELKGYEKDITASPSFTNLVSILNNAIDPNSPGYLAIPKGFHTRKEIVDRFVGDTAQKIKGLDA